MSMNKIKGGVKSVRETLASQLEDKHATPETNDSPFGLYLCLMYRDGSNYKSCRSVLMTNHLRITKETIEQAIASLDHEEIVPRQWGLPVISDVDHPDIVSPDEDEHCYHELIETAFVYTERASYENREYLNADVKDIDVSTLVEAVNNGGTEDWKAYCESRKDEQLSEAINVLKDNGKVILTQNELSRLEARCLPEGMDPKLVMALAGMALSHVPMFQSAVESGQKASDLYELQSDIARTLGL